MKNIIRSYFMDDKREANRLEAKVDAPAFVTKYLTPYLSADTGSILEAGCGPGMFLEELANEYEECKIIGIDISSDRVVKANERLSDHANAEARIASVYDLPFPDNHFDFIYSRFLFEYLEDPGLAAIELFRVCKPGGILFIQDLDNQFTFYPELSDKLNKCLQRLNQCNGFDPEMGRKLFTIGRSAGFSLVNADFESYHKIFGKADDKTQRQWYIKLDIAFANMETLFGKTDYSLKAEILQALQNEDSMMYSTVFNVAFTK